MSLFVLAACGVTASPGKDMKLQVTEATMSSLRALRSEPKFLDLPGAPAQAERRRLEPLFNDLLDRLVGGIQAYPSSAWVIAEMDTTVEAFHLEDTEARERCIIYIERIFNVLGIPNDGGAFLKYLIVW